MAESPDPIQNRLERWTGWVMTLIEFALFMVLTLPVLYYAGKVLFAKDTASLEILRKLSELAESRWKAGLFVAGLMLFRSMRKALSRSRIARAGPFEIQVDPSESGEAAISSAKPATQRKRQ